jgi:hypothetical protein
MFVCFYLRSCVRMDILDICNLKCVFVGGQFEKNAQAVAIGDRFDPRHFT